MVVNVFGRWLLYDTVEERFTIEDDGSVRVLTAREHGCADEHVNDD